MPHTLLLADDSVTIQRVIELTFADEDVEVVAVGDGDQAIAVLDARAPDIVLADVGMPGKNGYEVAAYIQSSPRLSHIPVLLLTGAFEPIDQERANRVGCDGVLAKPFEPQLVISRVKELLAHPKRRVVHSEAPTPPAVPRAMPTADAPPPVFRGPLVPGTPEADQYFDRLDAAFASLSSPAPGPASASKAVPDQIDWFAQPHQPASESDLSLSYPPPAAPSASRQPAPPLTPAFPPLADAFAALLAAEQSGPSASTAPSWPAQLPPRAAAEQPISDELIAQVTKRVLESLSDRVVRDAVADIVSSVAERLVKEEIERIKNSIK